MSRLKLTLIFAAAFAVAITVADARASTVDGSSYGGPSIQNQALPDSSDMPNSGKPQKDFTIGVKGANGYCDELVIEAPTLMDALSYAYRYCPSCNSIQDLTGQYVQGEAPWETTPRSQAFCMAR